MKTHFFLFFLIFSAQTLVGQMNWETSSWQAVLDKAQAENKLIFVDIYTVWCGPCVRMDKKVWIDETVQDDYNSSFINVRINAEDLSRGRAVAQSYNTSIYPTLLYLEPSGEVVSRFTGGQNRYEILKLSQNVKSLYAQKDFVQKVKANIDGAYTQDELANILDITVDHDFAGKERIAMRYLDQVSTVEEIDLRRVMPEVSRMDVSYLGRLAPLTGTVSYADMYLRRNSKEWISWRTTTEKAVYSFLNQFLESNNLSGYEQTLEILKGIEGVKPRKIDNLYLNFYRRNNLDQYRDFAIYLIDEYIIPTRPEDVKKADEQKYKMLREQVAKDMMASLGTDLTSQDTYDQSHTPTLDSIAEIYTISQSIADQLYDISSDFFAFYEDESSRRKASFWAYLATKYYPYDWKYYDNLIYMLEADGKSTEAQDALQEAKALPWYEEMKHRNSGP